MEAFLYVLEIVSIVTGVLIAVDKVLSIMAKHKTKFGEKTQERLVNNYKNCGFLQRFKTRNGGLKRGNE